MRLHDFKVLTFDCYGTLIDWESGLFAALQPLLARVSVPPTRNAALEAFAGIEAQQQATTPDMPYPGLLTEVHRQLAGAWNVPVDESEAVRFGRSISDWPAFPDTVGALRYLKQHFRLVILSNVDRAGFAASARRLEVPFDAIYTAQDIGSYKPDARNFHYLLEHLAKDGFEKREILHVAQSLFHDHGPANRVGLASAWIDRRHGDIGSGATMPVGDSVHYDFRFTSLEELAAAHRAETA